MSDDLIDRLAGELKPVARGALLRSLAIAALAAAPLGVAFVGLFPGFRPDLARCWGAITPWLKIAYGLAFAAAGLAVLERAGRPAAGSGGRRFGWAAAVWLSLGVLGAWQLAVTPQSARSALVMGQSSATCPWWIAATSIPFFLAMVLAVRRLAPTRPRVAGAAAGLTAGGFAIASYSLHCPEPGLMFIGLWYTLGALVPAAAGALLGPRLLRW